MTRPPLVLLHGFLGSGEDWDLLRGTVDDGRPMVALDLPGHGARPDPLPPGEGEEAFHAAVAWILAHAPPEPFDLLGYSLGGRLAFGVLCAAPERVRRALVVGASPGLDHQGERAARRELDAVRAAALRSLPFDVWLDTWYAAPLFDGLRASRCFDALLARRRTGQPAALAAALEAWSPGAQPPLRKPLAACGVPALLMAGALDAKYVDSNRALAEANPAFEAATVADAGHAPQLERPDEFHNAVRRWLDRP